MLLYLYKVALVGEIAQVNGISIEKCPDPGDSKQEFLSLDRFRLNEYNKNG